MKYAFTVDQLAAFVEEYEYIAARGLNDSARERLKGILDELAAKGQCQLTDENLCPVVPIVSILP